VLGRSLGYQCRQIAGLVGHFGDDAAHLFDIGKGRARRHGLSMGLDLRGLVHQRADKIVEGVDDVRGWLVHMFPLYPRGRCRVYVSVLVFFHVRAKRPKAGNPHEAPVLLAADPASHAWIARLDV